MTKADFTSRKFLIPVIVTVLIFIISTAIAKYSNDKSVLHRRINKCAEKLDIIQTQADKNTMVRELLHE